PRGSTTGPKQSEGQPSDERNRERVRWQSNDGIASEPEIRERGEPVDPHQVDDEEKGVPEPGLDSHRRPGHVGSPHRQRLVFHSLVIRPCGAGIPYVTLRVSTTSEASSTIRR